MLQTMPSRQILLSNVPFPGIGWLSHKSLMMDVPACGPVAWEDIFEFMGSATGLPHHLFEIDIGVKRVRYQLGEYFKPFNYDSYLMYHRDGSPSSQAFLKAGLNTSWRRRPLIDTRDH